MNTKNCLYAFLFLSFVLIGCKSKDTEDQRYTWVTDDPLTIPYKTRLQRLEKGNLVRNSSFETGKIYKIDSNTVSFSIDGWQQIGQNVEWVDISDTFRYKHDESYSGHRSVKVSRKKAFENDEKGEGIQSDFIKVIPGNYNLSVYLKLENILPQKARLGTKMFDGINISLLFFDRNKNIINGGYNFPQANQVINTSFKALSLANFLKIDKFNWGKITGKSHSFPFPEGNIPSEAHFVKIFIGLKGTGTLWVDSVNFHYSDYNFTLSEKMLKFTDTTFQLKEAIIPCPKKIKPFESIVYFHSDDTENKIPLIVIADSEEPNENYVASLIKQKIESGITKFSGKKVVTEIDVLPYISQEQINNSRLIISIGKTNVYEKYFDKLPFYEIKNHNQGYFIFTPTDQTNIIILGANDNIGLFYAANTLLQMFDRKAPVLHNARITDYPDFNNRFFTLTEDTSIFKMNIQVENINELIKYKFNGAFLLKTLQNNETGIPELQKKIEEDLFKVINLEGYSLPDDSLLSFAYPVIVKDLIKPLYSQYILPPLFNNQMLDNSAKPDNYLSFPSDYKYVYSGSSFFSIQTDDADIKRFIEFIGKLPVFMDNSMLISTQWAHYGGNDKHYPGRIRLFNLFEPYLNTSIKSQFSKVDNDLFVVNLPPNSEIEIIRLATSADFLWNFRTYSKEMSLWKVLVSRYGLENARSLINYNDKYSMLLQIILKLELQIQSAKNIKAGQQIMAELTSISAEISESLGSNNKLVKELLKINGNLRNEFNKKSIFLPVKN